MKFVNVHCDVKPPHHKFDMGGYSMCWWWKVVPEPVTLAGVLLSVRDCFREIRKLTAGRRITRLRFWCDRGFKE